MEGKLRFRLLTPAGETYSGPCDDVELTAFTEIITFVRNQSIAHVESSPEKVTENRFIAKKATCYAQ